MGSGFGILDSTSMEHAKRFNGHYNLIFVVRSIGEAMGPLFGGILVQDSYDEDGMHFSIFQGAHLAFT